MSSYPQLPLFTDAFLADTGHLTAQETGVYLLLLMMAWRQPECALPDDDAKLAKWARVDGRTWRRIKPTIMEFWTLSDGQWTQKRLRKEREFVSKRAEVARTNGQHGGRPNSLKTQEPDNPAGSSWDTQKKAPTPIPTPKEENPSSSLRSDDDPPVAENVVRLRGGPYAVDTGTKVRLNQRDLDALQKANPHVPVESTLWGQLEWLLKQPNWFFAFSSSLAKMEREAVERLAMAALEQERPPPKRDRSF